MNVNWIKGPDEDSNTLLFDEQSSEWIQISRFCPLGYRGDHISLKSASYCTILFLTRSTAWTVYGDYINFWHFNDIKIDNHNCHLVFLSNSSKLFIVRWYESYFAWFKGVNFFQDFGINKQKTFSISSKHLMVKVNLSYENAYVNIYNLEFFKKTCRQF